ncbi:glycosyltransferase [Halomonas sp. BN3-1]|uniref:glycosyltransferase n=1 Tax=Halomonas sp. BN3-1 TaxID=2082393 RepID=UPI000D36D124|nr:glycosyltransferase [Halomonas sp. BN3-1]
MIAPGFFRDGDDVSSRTQGQNARWEGSGSTRRVLFVIDHLDSGGAPVVARDLIVGMVDAGVEVTLVILSDRQRHVLPSSAEVVKLPYVAKGVLARQCRYRRHAQLLDRWLVQHGRRFDLVYAHLHHAHQVVSRSRLAASAWYCLHADPVTGFLGNKRGLGRWMKRRKVRALYQGRRIVTVSHGMLERLKTHFSIEPERGVGIHNPLDIERIQKLASDEVIDVPDNFLLYVGRMDLRQKRFDRLLDAYHQSGVALPLLLVGGGDGAQKVSAMIRERKLDDRVWLLGPRDNPYAYMARARALLLSSDYEGFPLVLPETLACGTPVVSVDCPTGPAELLVGELAPYLAPLDDMCAFADAISRVVEAPPVIGPALTESFRLDHVVKRYLALEDG